MTYLKETYITFSTCVGNVRYAISGKSRKQKPRYSQELNFSPSIELYIFDQSRQICTVCSACLESETRDVAVKFIQWKPIYSRKDTSFSMTYLLTDCYQTKLFLAHVWKSQCKTLQDMPSKGDRDTVRVTLLISKLPLAVDRLRPNLQFLYRMRGNFDV